MNGGSNDDPWDNVTWSMLIDSDGDGFKEFVVQLNGDTGSPSNVTDDITVYYDNTRSQALSERTTMTPTRRPNTICRASFMATSRGPR